MTTNVTFVEPQEHQENDSTASINLSEIGDSDVSNARKRRNSSASSANKKTTHTAMVMLYGVDDIPPWYLSIFLGFQHYLTLIGSAIAGPVILATPLCMLADDAGRGELISTVIFTNGVVTIFQSTIGIRLPIVQCGTSSFIVPVLAILALPQWKCPDDLKSMTAANKTEEWQFRMREIQGAIAVASVLTIFLGVTGIVGSILRFISPLTVAPAITSIGLALFSQVGRMMAEYWPISITTVVLLTLMSQYLDEIAIPIPSYKKGKGCTTSPFYLFRLFPVLTSLMLMWTICGILTVTDALPKDNPARTDHGGSTLQEAPWFRIPYPGQWGTPTVSVSTVLGIFAAIVIVIIDSIGDYFACARLSGAPPPPTHAVNRGITIEGFGCVLAGLMGAINGTTSFAENIGAISITKVSSRRVVQCAGVVMIFTGIMGKICSLFASIPEPVIGGILCVMCSIVTAIGVSALQFVNLNSSRNLFVYGFAVFLAMTIPQWMKSNPGVIQTGNELADEMITILLSTSMFVAGFTGCFLDNTIPGTIEERGVDKMRIQLDAKGNQMLESEMSCYDLPFGMNYIRSHKWTSYIPLSPTFTGWGSVTKNCLRKKKVGAAEQNNGFQSSDSIM